MTAALDPTAGQRTCAQRIRGQLAAASLDAVVLTHPHDVRYATGYHSVLERWTQMQPFAAAIVFADPERPLILALPEANIGILAVLAKQGRACAFDELRTFDMLNFCEVGRYADPDRQDNDLSEAAVDIAMETVRGACAPDIVASLVAALKAHGMTGTAIGYDDLRVGQAVAAQMNHNVSDALDFMVGVRVVKTPWELERYRKVGQLADEVIDFAGSLVQEGADWSDLQARVCDFMVRRAIIPVDEGAMLFGGSYDGDFIPDLFRTPGQRALRSGDIVILETQGVHDGFWIDINRTAVVGKPSQDYVRLHEILRDAFMLMVDRLRPGTVTSDLPAIGYEHLKAHGVAAPEKLLVVAHGLGLMPLEIPLPFPSAGLAGVKQGFRIEEEMLISLDSLFFGARLGPCHMENVYAVTAADPEPMYQYPLALIGAALRSPATPPASGNTHRHAREGMSS